MLPCTGPVFLYHAIPENQFDAAVSRGHRSPARDDVPLAQPEVQIGDFPLHKRMVFGCVSPSRGFLQSAGRTAVSAKSASVDNCSGRKPFCAAFSRCLGRRRCRAQLSCGRCLPPSAIAAPARRSQVFTAQSVMTRRMLFTSHGRKAQILGLETHMATKWHFARGVELR